MKSGLGWRSKKAADLIGWLNSEVEPNCGKPTKASRARVITLMNEINEAAAMLVASDLENPNRDFFDGTPETFRVQLARIQAILNDYPKWPTVEIAYRGMAAVLHFSDTNGAGRALGEQLAVWDITALAETGRSYFVRQCQCGRWFLARRADQKSCSPGCRHRTYEQTVSFKAKRREYMRDYYKLKQSGKVK